NVSVIAASRRCCSCVYTTQIEDSRQELSRDLSASDVRSRDLTRLENISFIKSCHSAESRFDIRPRNRIFELLSFCIRHHDVRTTVRNVVCIGNNLASQTVPRGYTCTRKPVP